MTEHELLLYVLCVLSYIAVVLTIGGEMIITRLNKLVMLGSGPVRHDY